MKGKKMELKTKLIIIAVVAWVLHISCCHVAVVSLHNSVAEVVFILWTILSGIGATIATIARVLLWLE